MTLLNLAIAAIFVFVGYKFIRLFVDACIAGWKQAEQLEKEFGFDVLGAARYQMGLARKDEEHE